MRLLIIMAYIMVSGVGFIHAQNHEEIISQINRATSEITDFHIETEFINMAHYREDTIKMMGTSYVSKNATDSILGMDIRYVYMDTNQSYEIIHKGTETWFVNYKTDTITRYDQAQGQWNGFDGNFRTSWTTETPLSIELYVDEDIEVNIIPFEKGNYIVHRKFPDITEYGITDRHSKWFINGKTMLPYKTISTHLDNGHPSYSELRLNIISTDSEKISEVINQPLPQLPIKDYYEDPNRYKPLPEGTETPPMQGYWLADSTAFDLKDLSSSKLILLDFWYRSCGPCIKAHPYLDSLEQEYGDKGLLLLKVNSVDHKIKRSELLDFIKKRGGSEKFQAMVPREVELKDWKNYVNPAYYFLQDGKIIKVRQGFGSTTLNEFRAFIEDNLE